MTLPEQAVLVAVVSWTVAREEVFSGLRAWCEVQMRKRPRVWWLFYPPTCAFCLSWWLAGGLVALERGSVYDAPLIVAGAAALRTAYDAGLGGVALLRRKVNG